MVNTFSCSPFCLGERDYCSMSAKYFSHCVDCPFSSEHRMHILICNLNVFFFYFWDVYIYLLLTLFHSVLSLFRDFSCFCSQNRLIFFKSAFLKFSQVENFLPLIITSLLFAHLAHLNSLLKIRLKNMSSLVAEIKSARFLSILLILTFHYNDNRYMYI